MHSRDVQARSNGSSLIDERKVITLLLAGAAHTRTCMARPSATTIATTTTNVCYKLARKCRQREAGAAVENGIYARVHPIGQYSFFGV